MVEPSSTSRLSPFRRAITVVGLVLGVVVACDGGKAEPITLERLYGRLTTTASGRLASGGLELDVSDRALISLDFPGVRAVEVDVVADGPFTIYWAAFDDEVANLQRYRTIHEGAASLRFDLSQTQGWTPESRPLLCAIGTGRLVFTAARLQPGPTDPLACQAISDRSMFWSHENLGHQTINSLEPPLWSASRRSWFTDRLACAALAAGVLVALWSSLVHRRRRMRLGVGAAALFAIGTYDAYFLVRYLPALDLVVEADPEARVRDNYYFAPSVGAVAALAGRVLGPEDRVGVIGSPDDWFAPQTICFLLAPRRCVIVRPDESELRGIADVERMHIEDLDAIVVCEADSTLLPPGFHPVASVNARTLVARRQ